MTNEERQNLVRYRLKRAEETLGEVSMNIQNKFWNTAPPTVCIMPLFMQLRLCLSKTGILRKPIKA